MRNYKKREKGHINKEKGQIKKEKEKSPKRAQNMKEREKGQCYYPFTTLVLHHVLHIESLLSYHFYILVGIFIIELGLYIPMMGFLKCPRSS